MEEQNTAGPSEKDGLKKQSKSKPEKKDGPSFSDTLREYKAEFKKIIWPNRKEVAKKTVTVIVTSLLIGVILFCMDTVYSTLYNVVLSLLS